MAKFISSSPGYFALWIDECDGTPIIRRSEIISWRIQDDGTISFVAINVIASEVVDAFIMCPDGHVEDMAGLYFPTYEHWLAHVRDLHEVSIPNQGNAK